MFSTPVHGPGSAEMAPGRGLGTYPSPTKLARDGLTPRKLGTQMVAENLLKLSKQGQKTVTYSGKRDEAQTWHFVFCNLVIDVFGDVARRLLDGTGYSSEEWHALEEWQQAYVMASDVKLHGYLLTCIQRDNESGQALVTDKWERMVEANADGLTFNW